MLLTVLLTVIAVSPNSIKEVNTKPVEGLDIENFLRSLQQQLQLEQLQQQRTQQQPEQRDSKSSSYSSSSDEDSASDDYSTGILRSQDVERLIKRNDRDDRNKQIKLYTVNDNDGRSDGLDKQLLQQLNRLQTVQNRNKKRQNNAKDRVMKQYRQPNNLFGSVGSKYDDRSNILLQSLNNDEGYKDLDLSGYSNIYLILNSDAVQNSQNKDSLNDLLSNLLFSSNQGKRDGREKRKDGRYKGFFVKDRNTLMRRRNRESREVFAKGNSIEEHKPKRSRGERGERGGGGGGRTAIPYIRHHGENIYEKDD